MLRRPLASSVLGFLVACGGTGDAGVDASTGDASIDAADASTAVSQGAPCTVEGATASTPGPYTCGTSGSPTCTCRSLHWDCACPCSIDLRTVAKCPECCMCNGGLATRCDGTTFVPKECHAACGVYLDWVCIDSVGARNDRCPHDGGTDADASKDASSD